MKTFHAVLSSSALLAIALLSGCATSGPQVQSHPDTTVAYENYKSFAMVYRSPLPVADNAAISPTLIRQVLRETESAFVAKGLVKAPDRAADLLVLVHGGLQDKLDVTDWGYGGPRLHRHAYDLQQYKEGTILIDVFDAKTRELVWRGSVVGEVVDSPKPEKVKAAIDAVVAQYPN